MAYTTREDVEAMFGTNNVVTWATMDNEWTDEQVDAHIDNMILQAEAEIDMELVGIGYEVPFTDPIPTMLVRYATILAALNIYENRGVQDYDERTGKAMHALRYHRDMYNIWITKLRRGIIDLVSGRTRGASPGVVKDDPPSCGCSIF